MNKRGWIHILEATIAVMIVAGVMVTVYSNQPTREGVVASEFIYSLQDEILSSITLNEELRLNVLRIVDDSYGDFYYDILDGIIAAEIPGYLGYLFRVCNLSSEEDVCNMPSDVFRATLDKDVFVEEDIVSSELGDGSDPIYSPKKLRLFVWEGDADFEGCIDECSVSITSCSLDFKAVLNVGCEDSDGDGCLEKNAVKTPCDSGEHCVDAACVDAPCSNTCSEDYFYCSGDVLHKMLCAEGADGCLGVGDAVVVEDCGDDGCSDGACLDGAT